ncbi:hypothetical protein LTR86_003687 [Recurvomyces mirabilis]|nr:hypothetical protein LTR86_003687 [Recurvomyces mirabilis]
MAQYFVDKALEAMPDIAPDGPLKGKGLLSPIGDPLGHVPDKGLMPIGHVVGAVAKPNGQAFLDVQKDAKEKITGVKEDDDEEEKENKKSNEEKPGGKSIGGNAQTGQNPLGL